MPTAFNLCTLAWGETDGYVCLSTRDPSKKGQSGYWRDHTYKWPEERARVEEALRVSEGMKKDVYWSPAVYSGPKRDKNLIRSLPVLWADLDEVDPNNLAIDIRPTAAWQTSPGRYQAIWKLPEKYEASTQTVVNKNLTYLVGADKGGWDLTQVLRLPGTINHKYDDEPTVKFEWMNGHALSPSTVMSLAVSSDKEQLKEQVTDLLPDPRRVLRKYKLKARAKQLLKARPTNATVGNRSERLWELECLLAESKLTIKEIVAVAKASAWNKFQGRPDELDRLFSEAEKAVRKVRSSSSVTASDAVVTSDGVTASDSVLAEEEKEPLSWTDFDRDHKPIQWLVADIWGESEVGFVSGLPKSYKSWITLDLAVSVATGSPFLGSFASRQSNVLLIQEEDPKPVMQDRLVRIAAAKGLVWAKGKGTQLKMRYDLPDNLYILSSAGMTVTDPDHIDLMEEWIRRYDIGLVILDPLMMMAEGVDEFKAFDFMTNALKPLKQLRARTQAAVCVVHHHVKQASGAGPGGQAMYGSVALWAWEEAALHLNVSSPGVVTAERFSKHANLPPLTIEVGNVDTNWAPDVHYGVGGTDLIELMATYEDGITLDEVINVTNLARDAAQRKMKSMEESGKVKRIAGRRVEGQRGRPPVRWVLQ